MCLGGGQKKQYNAYSGGDNSDFSSFENEYDKWAKGDLRDARHGTDYGKLNNDDQFENEMRKLGKDPQAMMELREMQRQHAIDLGKISIDQNFKKFDPGYFKDYRKDYTGYYNPQVEDQFNKTDDKLTATLADRGMLESSVGNASHADLFKDYGQAKTNIANEALDASNKMRGQVQTAKSNLYSLNEASADPMGVNAQAVGQATALVAPPTYSPIGSLFTAALSPFLQYQQAANNAPTRNYTSNYTTNGSGKVVY